MSEFKNFKITYEKYRVILKNKHTEIFLIKGIDDYKVVIIKKTKNGIIRRRYYYDLSLKNITQIPKKYLSIIDSIIITQKMEG